MFSVLLPFVLKSSSPGLDTRAETSPERSNDSIHILRNFIPCSPNKSLTKVVNVSDLHFIHFARDRWPNWVVHGVQVGSVWGPVSGKQKIISFDKGSRVDFAGILNGFIVMTLDFSFSYFWFLNCGIIFSRPFIS